MTYKLEFVRDALKEWQNLDNTVRKQFKKKLVQRLIQPKVPSDQLSGSTYRYKIKLRNAGFRLVYEVIDKEVVLVVAVGKRERNAVYKAAAKR